jgi:flagellar biogenesis protein FliO
MNQTFQERAMGLSRMTTRRWMAVVVYAAMDFAAHQGAFAFGSMVALCIFLVLTLVIPLIVMLGYVIRRVNSSTLY